MRELGVGASLEPMNEQAMDRSPIERVLVIIPTYNEAENIRGIVARLRRSVPTAHVLIADDNSPDGTGEIADELAAADSNIQVLHRPGKQGLAAAYLAGFQWGLDHGYDALVEMDADGSHRPELLPNILRKLQEADMVKGSRWVTGGRTDQEWYRELLSRGANIWIQVMMDMPVRDSTGGYNAFRASILRKIGLHNVESKGYTFQVDMTRRVIAAGGKVAEVPIYFPDRTAGTSKMSGNIIVEALARTAGWGAEIRWNQLKRVPGWVSAKVQGEPTENIRHIQQEESTMQEPNDLVNTDLLGGTCACGKRPASECGCGGQGHGAGGCGCGGHGHGHGHGHGAGGCGCGGHGHAAPEAAPAAEGGCGCGHKH